MLLAKQLATLEFTHGISKIRIADRAGEAPAMELLSECMDHFTFVFNLLVTNLTRVRELIVMAVTTKKFSMKVTTCISPTSIANETLLMEMADWRVEVLVFQDLLVAFLASRGRIHTFVAKDQGARFLITDRAELTVND
eukprot:TRINITY_DN1629_c0_g1_i2.p1 TRINITY_DN1629_c0_g1~~TRINITY_DN1629_c0_g1_i2.p1  ORF type:complete len:139 (+),score=7.51 TRINITY_DN1629_c0_g1_i2:89-505(+)